MGFANIQFHAARTAFSARRHRRSEQGLKGGVFSETRGIVKVSSGDSVRQQLDSGDLGTAFALATSLYGINHLKFSGNMGYGVDSGMPSAGFRTSYSRDFGGFRSRSLGDHAAVLHSQPNGRCDAEWRAFERGHGFLLASAAHDIDQFERPQPALGFLEIVYGVELDAVSFIQRLHYLSPYARITWTGLGGKIDLTLHFRQCAAGPRFG